MVDVILREDIPKLGQRGDIVAVKEGYARNYLLPRKLAMPATPGNRKQVAEMKAAAARKAERDKAGADSLAGQLAEQELVISSKAGESDQLFGSVTAMDIAGVLEAKGFQIDKRSILLDEPIKTLGEYQVPVWLHRDVTATVKVTVVREE